ncbi:MAG: hypothetical protein P1U89_27595 [Verrucomicrobiales bacterium]|nr:hypothetical protein [Verrucomicrobiales bacterium]
MTCPIIGSIEKESLFQKILFPRYFNIFPLDKMRMTYGRQQNDSAGFYDSFKFFKPLELMPLIKMSENGNSEHKVKGSGVKTNGWKFSVYMKFYGLQIIPTPPNPFLIVISPMDFRTIQKRQPSNDASRPATKIQNL